MTEIPEKPDGKLIEVGLAEIVKSVGGITVTVILVEWDSDPLVPIKPIE